MGGWARGWPDNRPHGPARCRALPPPGKSRQARGATSQTFRTPAGPPCLCPTPAALRVHARATPMESMRFIELESTLGSTEARSRGQAPTGDALYLPRRTPSQPLVLMPRRKTSLSRYSVHSARAGGCLSSQPPPGLSPVRSESVLAQPAARAGASAHLRTVTYFICIICERDATSLSGEEPNPQGTGTTAASRYLARARCPCYTKGGPEAAPYHKQNTGVTRLAFSGVVIHLTSPFLFACVTCRIGQSGPG